jgi:hypothetical protein
MVVKKMAGTPVHRCRYLPVHQHYIDQCQMGDLHDYCWDRGRKTAVPRLQRAEKGEKWSI